MSDDDNHPDYESVHRVQVFGTISFTGFAYIRSTSREELEKKLDRLRTELCEGKEIVAPRDLKPFELQKVSAVRFRDPVEVYDAKNLGAAEDFPNYVLDL